MKVRTPADGRRDADRLLKSVVQLMGPGCELMEATERPWASATFTGARHALQLRLPITHMKAPQPRGLSVVADYEFELPTQIVADCVVTHESRHIDAASQCWIYASIEVLTITAD